MSRKKNEHFSGYFSLPKIISDFVYEHSTDNTNYDFYITEVLYNDPATVVFWSDGTKTVAKCSGTDEYDSNVGLLIAVLKKFSGSSISRIVDDWGMTGKEYPARVTVKDVRQRNKDRLLR